MLSRSAPASQCGPCFGEKGQGLLKQFGNFLGHSVILLLLASYCRAQPLAAKPTTEYSPEEQALG